MCLAMAEQAHVPDKLGGREKRMTFEPRPRSCWVLRLRASRVLRNPRPKALRSSRPVEGASNKAAAAPMAIPASNHGIALPASACRNGSSECAWFVTSGSCELLAFLRRQPARRWVLRDDLVLARPGATFCCRWTSCRELRLVMPCS
jgi:hypothetical protein